MSFSRNLKKMSLSFAVLALVSVSAHAGGNGGLGGGLGGALGGLGGSLGGAVGGVTSGLGGAVGGVTSGLGGAVGGVTSGLGLGNATSGLGLGSSSTTTSNSVASTDSSGSPLSGITNGVLGTNANALNLVKAKLNVLTTKQLLGACAAAGGGNCDGATRIQLLHIINARLGLLNGKQIVSLCLGIGGGCGGGLTPTKPVTPPHINPPVGPGSHPNDPTQQSVGELDDVAFTCRVVLNHPASYDAAFVSLCRSHH